MMVSSRIKALTYKTMDLNEKSMSITLFAHFFFNFFFNFLIFESFHKTMNRTSANIPSSEFRTIKSVKTDACIFLNIIICVLS